MIQEITQRHYSGVLCSRGKERIPAPKRAVALYEEIKHGEGSDGQEASLAHSRSDARSAMKRAYTASNKFRNLV
jgi:hypothetical protein